MSQQVTEPARKQSALRFILCSILGCCIFFIKFPIEGKSVLPIDWITTAATTFLAPYYLYVSVLGASVTIYFLLKKRFWKSIVKNKVGFFFDLMGIIGFLLILLQLFKIAPHLVTQNNILGGAINTMAKMYVNIVIIMFFIPLLCDYGLPEAVGVFVRPICRTVWNVPGRAAVIIVSAFLGNFTVGHMQANMYYTEGKATHRESLIMALGFSTPSIGLILSMCATAGIADKFPLIMFMLLVIVLIITSITSHIYPINKYPNTYYEDIEPQPEEYEEGNPLSIAWKTAITICDKANNPLKQMWKFGIRSIPTVSNVCFIGVGTIVFFGLLNLYTPIFTWIGYLFYPVLKLMGMQAQIIAPNMGLGMVSTLAAQAAIINTPGATLATQVFGIGFVITILMFFGSFQASLYSTKIKVKMTDFIILYFERAYLTIILLGLATKLLFK
jgi:Uncharacterized protein conserved in bacteria